MKHPFTSIDAGKSSKVNFGSFCEYRRTNDVKQKKQKKQKTGNDSTPK